MSSEITRKGYPDLFHHLKDGKQLEHFGGRERSCAAYTKLGFRGADSWRERLALP